MFKSDERQETPQRPQDGVSDPIGFNLIEAVLHTWNVNVFALVPIDDTESRLNSVYAGGALDTYGVDIGYSWPALD